MSHLSNDWLWILDGWIIAAGVLCAISSSLVGNFLVLRRMSMLGDAVSHAVLPGLAAAFLITGSRHSIPMFIGAAVVGVLTAVLTQWVRGFGKVDEGAAMGVVFTTLFALGLVMIVRAADTVDLDPGCVLYGAIEFTPLDTVPVYRDRLDVAEKVSDPDGAKHPKGRSGHRGQTPFPETQDLSRHGIAGWEVPRVVLTLGVVTGINLLFVVLLYKELKLTSFDPALADTMGLRSGWIHYLLMTLVAITAVASFESVGNILVVAMMVVPAAAASLLTDRLPWLIFISAIFGAISAVLGHLAALTIPPWFGYASTSTAGMMALVAGLMFVVVLILSPKQGLLIQLGRRLRLSLGILGDDILAYLYRAEEKAAQPWVTRGVLQKQLLASSNATSMVLWWYRLTGKLRRQGDQYGLTDEGRVTAASLVRSHRLWEQYLVDQAGVASDRIHSQAERLEHFTNKTFRDELERQTAYPSLDPHGSPIPAEQVKGNTDTREVPR